MPPLIPEPGGFVKVIIAFYFPESRLIKGLRGIEARKKLRSIFVRAVPLEAMTAKLAAGSKGLDKERSPRRAIEQR